MPKRAPFLRGRGQCIFCTKRPPEVKITDEHIFGDWLRVAFPRDEKSTHTYGVIDFPIPGSKHGRPVGFRKTGQGHSGSKKVYVVCRDCNETWMSNEIEDRAKPILLPLIAGQSISLNSEMQRILALWAAKTAMTGEHFGKKKAAITQDERTFLKENLSPPPGWSVWMRSYEGTDIRDLGLYQHVVTLDVPTVYHLAVIEHYIQLNLIGLGQLVFLIGNSSWVDAQEHFRGLRSAEQRGFVRIYPTDNSEVIWPRWPIVTDNDIRLDYLRTFGKEAV